MTHSVTRLAEAIGAERWLGAQPIGVHLEGPWISPAAAGAQPIDGIRSFDLREGSELLARGEGTIKIVSLAPEIDGVEELQGLLEREGVVMALGHSRASASQANDAVERGARHATHLFNAMGLLHHRDPGLAGFALTDDRVSCDLICVRTLLRGVVLLL